MTCTPAASTSVAIHQLAVDFGIALFSTLMPLKFA
jgi:hypothetical protein